ncbi:hypothetical protein FHX15_003042 [Rhizobium sp. BK650]|uniref:DoxX family protein n=1 Tax=Rhizobium sp. BK650 TaxID=2586990 RepID=UPI0018372934|nr:hypothetical protein [Rhizobium sp. BK650]
MVVVLLVADAATNLFAPNFIRGEMEATGFSANLAPTLGVIIAICAVLYAVPRTAFLGAILVTGFLGGAICTHFRLGEFFTPPQIVCLLLGLAAWGGLYLREPRLRQLLPLDIG